MGFDHVGILISPKSWRASFMAEMVKNPPIMQGT